MSASLRNPDGVLEPGSCEAFEWTEDRASGMAASAAFLGAIFTFGALVGHFLLT